MTDSSAPLILASGSPRRKDLLREAGYDFEVILPEVDEEHDESAPMSALTGRNARRKGMAVSEHHPARVVLAADTLVSINGSVLGKPADLEEAVAMLSQLVGRTHEVCTAVCLARGNPAVLREFSVVTRVTFRPLSREQIDHYLTLIDPCDKAGAYAAQEHGDLIIEKVDGSWTNVVGLPMDEVTAELAQLGILPRRKVAASA